MYEVKNITKDPRRLNGKIILPGEKLTISNRVVSNNIFEVKEIKEKKE